MHDRGGILARGCQARARRQELLSQILHEVALSILRLHVSDTQHVGQRFVPLQMKPAGAQSEERAAGERDNDKTRVHTTRFTSLPGTKMTLRKGLSPTNFITCSSASAAARAALSSALTAMWPRPRSLPFTCTTISRVSCSSACASPSGHGASRSSP